MILHPKYLDLTVDDLPDGEYLKAVTDGDQTIESLLTFYRAPRVQSIPATPNPRDLITRGQVRALAEQVIARSRSLDWDFSGGPVLVVDPTPAVPEPVPGPRCRIAYQGKYAWQTVIEWECFDGPMPEGVSLRQRQSYEASDQSYYCVGTEVRKVVYVREPYVICE